MQKYNKKLSHKKLFSFHHIIKILLTKWGFDHVKTFFRSFWTISVDIKNPYEFEVWVQKCVFSTISAISIEYSTGVEISTWKLFFGKVQIISYIFHIYHMCSKWILMELRAFQVTCKIIVFCQHRLWKFTCGFTEKTVIFEMKLFLRKTVYLTFLP